MSSPLVNSAAITIMEKAINSALQLDPGTLSRLQRLEGKVVQISCTRPSLSLLLIPDSQGLLLQSPPSDNELSADCHISGDSLALLSVLTATHKSDALFNPKLVLKGNTDIAQQLQRIMSDLDIDWEEKISHWLGDIAAHQLGNQIRSFINWGGQTLSSLVKNTEEYLHEEVRAMPPRLELESFYQDIEQLAVETDRIDARIQRLSANLMPHTEILPQANKDSP